MLEWTVSPSPYLLFNFWFDEYNQKQEQKNSDCETSWLVYARDACAKHIQKSAVYLFCHLWSNCLIFWCFFLANSSMFPNPFFIAVILSHSCRRSPPGHSTLALSQYKVICLRMFFTLCSVLQNTQQLSLLSMMQSLRPWSLRSTISEKEVFSTSFHKKSDLTF